MMCTGPCSPSGRVAVRVEIARAQIKEIENETQTYVIPAQCGANRSCNARERSKPKGIDRLPSAASDFSAATAAQSPGRNCQSQCFCTRRTRHQNEVLQRR